MKKFLLLFIMLLFTSCVSNERYRGYANYPKITLLNITDYELNIKIRIDQRAFDYELTIPPQQEQIINLFEGVQYNIYSTCDRFPIQQVTKHFCHGNEPFWYLFYNDDNEFVCFRGNNIIK